MISLNQLLFALINGAVFGGLLMLTALGLTLVFGVMDVPNFAQGEYASLAGYATVGLLGFGVGLLPAALISLALAFVAGVVTERLVIARFYDVDDFLIVAFFATFGLTLSFEAFLNITVGSYGTIPSPDFGSVMLFGSQLSVFRLVTLVFVVITLILLFLFTKYTYTGLAIRALADDADSAELLGIDPSRIYPLTFGIGAVLTGITGILYGMLFSLTPTLGAQLTAFAFVIVVVGGIGSFGGALAISLFIGVVQNLTAIVIGAKFRMFVVFLILLGILIVNREGMRGELA
ncbi:branched-chain amino acid ABC transporter permease [Halovenus marina]|uniref:branched-chain amino acid ABC transporter permease n=1 Tax=Halovenus marina TaxID=3396621 RepID=UPI003F578119